MELRRYLAILRRRALLILLAVVVAVGVTDLRTNRTPRYVARATLYVGSSNFNANAAGFTPSLSADQAIGLTRLINTYAKLIVSDPIARDALAVSHVQRPVGSVVAATKAEPEANTNLLHISVTDADPAVAQALANGVADAFAQKSGQLEPSQSGQEGAIPVAPVQVFERAKLPTVPIASNLASNMFLAGVLALAAAVAAVLLVEYLDITLKSAEEAERRLELPVLAVIPMLRMDSASLLHDPAERGQTGPVGLVQNG